MTEVTEVTKVTQGFLVVTAGGARYGLGLADVREVVDLVAPRPVPVRNHAVRGVMPLRERFVSLVHLASLVSGGEPPPTPSDTAVVVQVRGVPMALEVDDVEAVVEKSGEAVGAAPAAWSSGVWRIGKELVTVLDLSVLTDRVRE